MSDNLMQVDAAASPSFPFIDQPEFTTTHGSQSEALDNAGPWAKKIKQAWNKSVHSIVEAGQYLGEAKDTLEDGEWKALLGLLPFSKRTAERLIAIGRSPLIADHLDKMPPSWRTLDELSKLPEDVFRSALEDGSINPEMQRSEVARLKPQKPQNSKPTADENRPLDADDNAASDADYDAASIAESCIAQLEKQLASLPAPVASEVENTILRWLNGRVAEALER